VVFLDLSPLGAALVSRVGPRRLMVAGILAVAASFLRLSAVQRGSTYAETILPATLLWGLGIGAEGDSPHRGCARRSHR
jgi:peptidoglycan/LPS O-acetylase OafA/YrhL